MSSSPRTPRATVKVRRLPKVGDVVMVPAKVTRLAGAGDDLQITIELRNGHRATSRPEVLLRDEDR
jgi:ribosomal protein L18E